MTNGTLTALWAANVRLVEDDRSLRPAPPDHRVSSAPPSAGAGSTASTEADAEPRKAP